MKNCLHCNKILELTSAKKFCGSSCSAKFNNSKRTFVSTEKRKSQKYSLGRKELKIKNSDRFTVECPNCSTLFCQYKTKSPYCSKECASISKANKLSKVAKENNLGGVRASKRIDYNGQMLGSSYELSLAQDLDANGIIWNVPPKLTYIDPYGKARTYQADFYLPDYDVYLDPKNDFLIENVNPALGFTDTEKISLVSNQNTVDVVILNKNELNWSTLHQKIINKDFV